LITVSPLTLGIQLVIFLGLVVLLNFLLFQPILRVLDRRAKVLRDQNALREEFTRLAEEKTKAHDDRILDSHREAAGLRAEARSQGSSALRAMVQRSRDENLAEVDLARKGLAAGAQQARAGMRAQVEGLAGDLAASLIGRKAGGR